MKTKTKRTFNRASYGKNIRTGKIKDDPKPTLVCLLLDRSGSMSGCKDETISGFNAYVYGLKAKHTSGSRFHFVQFDSMGIDTMQDMCLIQEAATLTNETFAPRANTPLNDAVGRTIREVEERANRHKFKVVFVVQTDGQENASSEFTSEAVKALMKQMENEHKWTFAFIGTGPDGWGMMQRFSHGTQSMHNVMKTTGRNMARAMRICGQSTSAYMCSVDSGDAVATKFYNGKEDQT